MTRPGRWAGWRSKNATQTQLVAHAYLGMRHLPGRADSDRRFRGFFKLVFGVLLTPAGCEQSLDSAVGNSILAESMHHVAP